MRKLQILFLIFVFAGLVFGQTSKFVETDNLKIHYLEWGEEQETIILIHGRYDTSEVWQELAILLAKKYRVIAPDRRGLGLSLKVLNGYEIENLSKDLNNLIKELNISKFHFIGHSAGGNTAMTYAVMFPEEVESLVLIEGGFWKKGKAGKIQDCPKPLEKECLSNQRATIENYKYNAEKLYSKVFAPTLLVLAIPQNLEKADIESKQLFESIRQVINLAANVKFKNGRFSTINDTGHFVQKDQPELLSKLIIEFHKKQK
ncbi:MAG: alpha/beta fold hydrolase [Aridibacter sp.]